MKELEEREDELMKEKRKQAKEVSVGGWGVGGGICEVVCGWRDVWVCVGGGGIPVVTTQQL